MASSTTEDLINFDLIETHKENIQSLPGGRSAKQLVSILSPHPSSSTTTTRNEPTLNETKTLNDAIRQEYENELLSIADSDDPLDIFDRYVKWTFNAYPSAQATPQSQLLPLLERATKTFLTSAHYKNDPRYLKLWLHYIRLFSDAPRETFAFLARHHVGETLGLFYEEFAAWLEGAGRWNQADEVYRMGVEREARPAERLMRKYNQFQQRYEARPKDVNEPSSPALPTVRPALAAKIDPFAASTRSEDGHVTQRPGSGGVAASGPGSKSKSGKIKMAIFNDADNETPPPATNGSKGWDSIGSMRERKKENTIDAKPWTGETLKAGKRVGTVPKMEIFKDPTSQIHESKKNHVPKPSSSSADVLNPRTGRSERVFVSLEAVYPNESEEYSFEELRAMRRGWMDRDWRASRSQGEKSPPRAAHSPNGDVERTDVENLSQSLEVRLNLDETDKQSQVDVVESRAVKQKKTKMREVKQESQTVKARLDSPTGPKIKRKGSGSGSAEPTMTFHSKAAMNDIYNIFNHSKKEQPQPNSQIEDETDDGEDTYSVGTGHASGNNSEFGDDTTRSFGAENTSSQPGGVSPWSDFTLSKQFPEVKNNGRSKHKRNFSEDVTESIDSSQTQTVHDGAFDTMAIAALANQDFGELDTKMIAQLAGDVDDEDKDQEEAEEDEESTKAETTHQDKEAGDEFQSGVQDLKTPVDEDFVQLEQIEIQEKARFVPIPPEDYEPTPVRPYRDATAMAQNKLPFMTPIVERTESSMAPSTIFQNADYFTVNSPSQLKAAEGKNDSPSKLVVENLLLGSPGQESPSSSKRRRPTEARSISDEDQQGSPPKKFAAESPIRELEKIPFLVPASTVARTAPDTIKSGDDKVFMTPALPKTVVDKPKPIHKGPIILDLQCNPCDTAVRQQILDTVYPSISTYAGFVDSSDQDFSHQNILKAFITKQKKDTTKSSPRKGQNDKTMTKAMPPLLKFNQTSRVYAVKKELGKGAYAPVYLVDSYDPTKLENSPSDSEHDTTDYVKVAGARGALEAMKTECPPLTLAWEFYILQVARSRLSDASRAVSSIIKAQECHLYRDECYLILDYYSQGTLLDLVNLVRADNARAGKTAEGLDETMAVWLSVELLRILDEVWRVGLLHGDLKIDNCLVRFDTDVDVTAPYSRDGSHGWAFKGMTLIDFGRGIDTRAFKPEAKFVADWRAEETDCAEIREARPWKYEIDLFGAAGVMHSLLFGKYIETVAVGSGGVGLGQKKEWKLRDNLKRYWERDLWTEVFNVLINGGKLNGVDEVRREVGRVRVLMEDWLENEGERGGRDLRGAVRKCERLVKAR